MALKGRNMKKHLLIIILVTVLSVGFISASALASVTVATFADPSRNSGNPLFAVDFTNMNITGGWADTKTGLILEIPCSGFTIANSNAFQDAWFDMSPVTITTVNGMSGVTGGGAINFYADGTSANPLVTVSFLNGEVSRYGLGADEIFTANVVTISGSEIIGVLSEEQFSFSFANLGKLPGHTLWTDGFTSTAAFTSSAVITPVVPEPATICILGFGALSLIRRKINKNSI
jgi:hypothetical protein